MPAGTILEAIRDQNRCQDHFRCRTTLDDAHTFVRMEFEEGCATYGQSHSLVKDIGVGIVSLCHSRVFVMRYFPG